MAAAAGADADACAGADGDDAAAAAAVAASREAVSRSTKAVWEPPQTGQNDPGTCCPARDAASQLDHLHRYKDYSIAYIKYMQLENLLLLG